MRHGRTARTSSAKGMETLLVAPPIRRENHDIDVPRQCSQRVDREDEIEDAGQVRQ